MPAEPKDWLICEFSLANTAAEVPAGPPRPATGQPQNRRSLFSLRRHVWQGRESCGKRHGGGSELLSDYAELISPEMG